jgi:hypothetical protein
MPTRTPPIPKPKKPDPLDGLPQIERFKAVAREMECDEDPAAFEVALQQIARHKPNLTKSLSGLAAIPIPSYQNRTEGTRMDSLCSDRSLAWRAK